MIFELLMIFAICLPIAAVGGVILGVLQYLGFGGGDGSAHDHVISMDHQFHSTDHDIFVEEQRMSSNLAGFGQTFAAQSLHD